MIRSVKIIRRIRSTTSAIASLLSNIAPSTDCSAARSCGGWRPMSPPTAAGRSTPTTLMRHTSCATKSLGFPQAPQRVLPRLHTRPPA
ncbi:hypothetical protein I553_10695 [Mycobacterium xenopi 4042]|uniref:Secreted protein n=1 Tax=Mycobacterium xenopi 4042 TaxID=1299334 RepID=X8DCE6_MYCXE|nr:hypothetical protein I553_10695 [Mycobacterium xenopi 4042]